MPRYYFDSPDDEPLTKHQGIELADITSANREALRRAGQAIESGLVPLGHGWDLQMWNEKGRLLLRLTVVIGSETAAEGLNAAVTDAIEDELRP